MAGLFPRPPGVQFSDPVDPLTGIVIADELATLTRHLAIPPDGIVVLQVPMLVVLPALGAQRFSVLVIEGFVENVAYHDRNAITK